MPIQITPNSRQDKAGDETAYSQIQMAVEAFLEPDPGTATENSSVRHRGVEYLNACTQTDNFLVYAGDQRTANEIGRAAESLRKSLAQDWLGKELPNSKEPLTIGVIADPKKGASGATVFELTSDGPKPIHAILQGSRERILDSVLPHELMHTILATHLKENPPKWADEGASANVEGTAEVDKLEKSLITFLRTNRGIAFNEMLTMKEYPKEVLTLYAQGQSVTRFLVELGDEIQKNDVDGSTLSGKQRFVKFLELGMRGDTLSNWEMSVEKCYGRSSVGELQTEWNQWLSDSLKSEGPNVDNTDKGGILHNSSLVLPPRPGPSADMGPTSILELVDSSGRK